MLFIVHRICNSKGQVCTDRIRLMAKMTPHELKLVPIEWRQKH
jgi:hypothetical protein